MGWLSERLKNNCGCIKIDHSATVHAVGSSNMHEVHVIFLAVHTDTEPVEFVFILKLNAACGDNFCEGLFYKTFPAFYCDNIQLLCDSDLYHFVICDCKEITLDIVAPHKSSMHCLMFKANDPTLIYSNQCIVTSVEAARYISNISCNW